MNCKIGRMTTEGMKYETVEIPTALSRWKSFLDEQGIEYRETKNKLKILPQRCVAIYEPLNRGGRYLKKYEVKYIEIRFTPNGSLYRKEE